MKVFDIILMFVIISLTELKISIVTKIFDIPTKRLFQILGEYSYNLFSKLKITLAIVFALPSNTTTSFRRLLSMLNGFIKLYFLFCLMSKIYFIEQT